MIRTRVCAVLALGALVFLYLLLLTHPNVHYRDSSGREVMETSCTPVLTGSGEAEIADADSLGPRIAVAHGAAVADKAQRDAMDNGVQDEGFVNRQLRADCADRRTTMVAWSILPAGVLVLALVGLAPAFGRALEGFRDGARDLVPRAPENWRDLP